MCILGKIVKSNSHTDYVCQVVGQGEAEYVPQNTDYAFGTFVKIDLNDHGDRCLVGLIYDTVLLNPDFGRLGPRLSTESDLRIFSPDYLNERAVLIGILVVGQIVDDTIQQGVPILAATNEALVSQLDNETVKQFHIDQGKFQLTYMPNLMGQTGLLARNLALGVLQQLGELMPENQPILHAITDDLKWQLHINSMRGQP
jgi:hypothetical protein